MGPGPGQILDDTCALVAPRQQAQPNFGSPNLILAPRISFQLPEFGFRSPNLILAPRILCPPRIFLSPNFRAPRICPRIRPPNSSPNSSNHDKRNTTASYKTIKTLIKQHILHIYKLGEKLGATATSSQAAGRCQFRQRCPRSGPPAPGSMQLAGLLGSRPIRQATRFCIQAVCHQPATQGRIQAAGHAPWGVCSWPLAAGTCRRPPVGGSQNETLQ